MTEKITNINTQKIASEAPVKIVQLLERFFNSHFFHQFVFYAKIFSIILTIVLTLSIVLLFVASKPIDKFKKYLWKNTKPVSKTKYQANWSRVQKRIFSRQEAEYKLAVIEADKIIDSVLYLIGYKGNTLGEKLKKMNKGQIACLDDIWEAHKLRNRIVHYPDERVTLDEAEAAIKKFQQGLEELDIL